MEQRENERDFCHNCNHGWNNHSMIAVDGQTMLECQLRRCQCIIPYEDSQR